jgi:hypothetical protein
MKGVYDKPLPEKPNLRPQESPERRGVFDAQDLIINSLNGIYPPLEPASSPEIYRTDQQSPASSSFQIAPSLLSRNQSPNSVSTAEFGVAITTTIHSVINSKIAVDAEHTYTLNAPRPSKIPRLGSRLRNGQPSYGSPSRSPSLGSKVNRSMLRGRQVLGIRGRQSLTSSNSLSDDQIVVRQEAAGADVSRPNLKNPLEESPTEEGTQRTSKYGYKIRESLEARGTIMGDTGSTITPPAQTPLHPPRTSSLPKTPSPRAIGASNAKSLPIRPPVLHRQTAASSARASFNVKKISESRASISRIPQSRTFASLGDVGKGMKNFGKKVGKIIPHRRSMATETTSAENLHGTSEQNREPRRQASRLLTTYKNSGMEECFDAIPHHSVIITDGFNQPEANDRHEPDGADKEKMIWYNASRNLAHDTETGRFVRFGQRNTDGSDDEDEERPPSRTGIRIVPGGHYVEDAMEQGGDNIIDFANLVEDEDTRDAELPPTRRGSVESNATAATSESNITPVVVAEANNPARSVILDPQFSQMLTQTESRARQLLALATELDDSPMRTLLIETATRLAEGVMHTREARIDIFRSSQALDEATVILATNTNRMSSILRQISAQLEADRSTGELSQTFSAR